MMDLLRTAITDDEVEDQACQISSSSTLSISRSVEFGSASSVIASPGSSSVVIAVDLGTTYSGYAFAFSRFPETVYMMRVQDCGEKKLSTQKIPTSLLLTPSGEFHSFGYDARDHFNNLEKKEAKLWMYFERFKMSLYRAEAANLQTTIRAVNGKDHPAIDVFRHTLNYIRLRAMEDVTSQTSMNVSPSDVTWVITVPAIWTQQAKQFMRVAAFRAGLTTEDTEDRLVVALEPEAASVFCRKLRQRDCCLEQELQISPAVDLLAGDEFKGLTQYMIVDCGGGTVDIAVHELDQEKMCLKELKRGVGGPYGGSLVNQRFEALLCDIFGTDFISSLKVKRPSSWLEVETTFEIKKRTVRPGSSTPINLSLPFSFIDYYKKHTGNNIANAFKKCKNQFVRWSTQGMMRIDPELIYQMFDPVVSGISSLVTSLLEDPALERVRFIFLVGGFAESPIVQQSFRRDFAARCRVVVPHDVQLCVLKGAVMYGLDTSVIKIRRAMYTYGVGVYNKFDESKHPKSKRVVRNGKDWCKDVFDAFVRADASVNAGDKVMRRYTPTPKSSQKYTTIKIFMSENSNPLFTTDPGVLPCGQIRIETPTLTEEEVNSTQGSGPRELQATMYFGDTEIKVTAFDVATKRCTKAVIDFMSY